ncbi:MAG: EAL domain-containing protein [Proteobacteria bacterium]|nr:EAL domain-containing protein [Pseudomonadota bacterium]
MSAEQPKQPSEPRDGTMVAAVAEAPRAPRRLSLAGCFALALLGISAVLLVGMLLARHATRDAIAVIAGAETRYAPLWQSSQQLLDTITVFDRTIMQMPRRARPDALAAAEALGAGIEGQLDHLAAELPPDGFATPAAARGQLAALRELGLGLIEQYRHRDADSSAAERAMLSLAVRSSRAGSGYQSGDQVLARKSLADLERLTGAARQSLVQALAAPAPANEELATRDLAAVRRFLGAHATEFSASPGHAWLELETDDFEAAAGAWQRFLVAERHIAADRAAFEASEQQLVTELEAGLRQSASAALQQGAVTARETAEAGEAHLTRIAAGVLLVLLVIVVAMGFGIVGPARRLLIATRRLGAGELDVRVPRGGIRELDELAGAFNVMAAALHESREALREQHAALEQRVSERTAQLRYLANHDWLTGLPNRRDLERHLAVLIERVEAGRAACALLYLDIDNFKTMNDTLGHGFGDRVLRQIAQRLHAIAGERAFLARLGGDEFTIVVEGVDSGHAAETFADEIIAGFRQPVRTDGRELLVSVSIGIALCPDHGRSAEALLQAADSALFHAKDRGRKGHSIYQPDLLAAASHRFHTEQGLRRALEAGNLLVYLQPQVSLEQRRVTTLEALVRWRTEDGAIVPAAQFITVAEQSGLIVDISDWVLRAAVEMARELRGSIWPSARIAVNVSAQQFLAGRFVEKVEAALHAACMPPDCLEIELTETAAQTGRVAVESLYSLRRLGVAIALDDFGAGYSSLKSLEELPLTRVKLDRSLTRGIDTNFGAAAIAGSVIRLCQELGVSVTAEGIERTAQIEALGGWGPVELQGYLIARPMPLVEAAGFIVEVPTRLAHLRERAVEHPEAVRATDEAGVVTPFRPRAR